MKTLSTTLLAVLALMSLSGCLAQSYCTRAAECADDPPGEDFVAVCQARYEGTLNALRANKEDVCHEVARAKEAFDSCRTQLDGCRDFNRGAGGDYDGECENERDDYIDALQDAENECGTLD